MSLPAELTLQGGGPLRGTLVLPGDKSISHRSLLFAALSGGTSRVRGLLRSGDVHATMGAVVACGAVVEDGDELLVHGPEVMGEPADVVDCGNSGTSMRLLCGVFAAREAHVVLTGDHSLRRRPMGRVVHPLRRMGARIDGREGGRLAPLAIRGGVLEAARHDLSIASAQVKSALLLAGLGAGVHVREPRTSRDHSERFLRAMGASLHLDEAGWLHLEGGQVLHAIDVEVPADVSSSAFPLVAASLIEGSEVVLPGVGLNPTRTGVIDALRAMGADIEVIDRDDTGVEPRGTLVVRSTQLKGCRIDGDLALRSLDELPVLSVAAAFAEGETVIADAEELRVKESDRIARVATGLRAMGVEVEEKPDGMVIQGGRPSGPARIDASGDHRIAMSFAVAAMASDAEVTIGAADAVASSWPTFYDDMRSLQATS